MKRQFVDAEAKVKEKGLISNEDASWYSSILIEYCYRRLEDIYSKEKVNSLVIKFYNPCLYWMMRKLSTSLG